MGATLHFGNRSSCHLQWDGVAHYGPAPHEPIDVADLPEQVRAALLAPLGYPPLPAATVPGDRVVVALAAGLPQLRELVDGVSRALWEAGVDRSQTTFLCCQESAEAREQFDNWAAEYELSAELHDPGDENSCSLLGVSQAGHALRLNRKLCDADIVLPVGVTCSSLDLENEESPFRGLFPHFSDEATIARHQSPESKRKGESQRERREEVDESGWLLGVGLAVQTVPGAAGSVAAVFAGDPAAAAGAATRRYHHIWRRPVAAAGDLVIATLSGPASEQTWENVARALLAAEEVLEPGGAIAVCSELAEPPGPALRRLRNIEDFQRLEPQLQRDPSGDRRTALAVCRALERGPVYLVSQLSAEPVESLGLAPVASEAELAHLVKAYQRPLVLEDAHRLLPGLTHSAP